MFFTLECELHLCNTQYSSYNRIRRRHFPSKYHLLQEYSHTTYNAAGEEYHHKLAGAFVMVRFI